jgi:hypothetical protein
MQHNVLYSVLCSPKVDSSPSMLHPLLVQVVLTASAIGSFGEGDGFGSGYHSFGAGLAEVEVDVATGAPRCCVRGTQATCFTLGQDALLCRVGWRCDGAGACCAVRCHVLQVALLTLVCVVSLLLQGSGSCVLCSSCLMQAGASTLQWTWARCAARGQAPRQPLLMSRAVPDVAVAHHPCAPSDMSWWAPGMLLHAQLREEHGCCAQ